MHLPVRALPWLLALSVVVVYLPALTASFQFDDWQVVLGDVRVASVAAWWQSMPGMRALVKLSYALNHEAGGGVGAFRAINMLLHALNTALVFLLVHALARRMQSTDEGGLPVVAATAALVFALHPVQTESVTYIAARPNLVATLFCLAALLAWLRGRAGRAGLWWPLAALCFVAALAGKETAAVLPLAMLLCLVAEGRLAARDLGLPLGLAMLCVGIFLLAWPHLPYDYLLSTSLQTRAPIDNLVAQAQGVTWLAGQLVRWDRLNADPMLQPQTALNAAVLLHATMLGAVLVLGALNLRRRPALGFGILWFFLWLAPTNSLLARLDVANDRQLYFALLGPAWCVGHAFARWRRHAWVAMLALLLLLALGTVLRNRVYATEARFWADVVAKSPHNARAWNNLGMAEALACRPAAARSAFEEAIRRDPANPQPQVNLALLQRGELPDVARRCL